MRVISISLIVFVGMYSCSKTVEKIEQTPVGFPTIILVLGDTNFIKRQGVLFFKQKLFSGFIIDYHQNKKMASRNSYYKGKLEGKQEKWYDDWSKMEVCFYKANRKTGEHHGWWKNGKMKFEYFIQNDVPIKTHQEWYQNGQLFSVSNFHQEGQPEGEQKAWFENGQIKSNYVITDGRRYGFLGAKGCMGKGEKRQTELIFRK
jgi:antitoxin component YwqK of YwqJK toxin-antitoxin module